MSHIFISYSRKDVQRAGKLVAALAENKLDTWIDWKSIAKGERWEQEIYRGIEEADAFLFLISPDSVISDMCNKEIGHALANNKRMLPIVIRDTDLQDIHPELSKRNWIFCRSQRDNFGKAIREIRKTIRTDYDWLRYHTELQVKALKWEQKRDASRLSRGKELQEAEEKLAGAGIQKDPQPTDLQRQYILMSRKHEERLRRTAIVVSVAAGIIMLVLGLYAQGQGSLATNRAATAQALSTREAEQAGTARAASTRVAEQAGTAQAANTQIVREKNTAEAERSRAEAQAQIALSRQLAAQSVNQLNDNNYRLAMLLAVESGRSTETYEAFSVLREMIPQVGRPLFTLHANSVLASPSPNGSRILTAGKDGSLAVWNAETGAQLFAVQSHASINQAVWSPDGSQIVTAGCYQKSEGKCWDGSALVWSASTGKQLLFLPHVSEVWRADWNADGSHILTQEAGMTDVWNAKTGKLVLTFSRKENSESHWNSRGNHVLNINDAGIPRIWDVQTGKELLDFSGGTRLGNVLWNFDESMVFPTGIWTNELKVTDVKTGDTLLTIPLPVDRIYESAWSADGSRILVSECTRGVARKSPACPEGIGQVWDVTNKKQLFSLSGERAFWSADGRQIVTINADRMVGLWDAGTGQQLQSFVGHAGMVHVAALSSDGSRILIAGCDEIQHNFEGPNAPDCYEGSAQVWDTATGTRLLTLLNPAGFVMDAAWSADDSRVLTRSSHGAVQVWDVKNNHELPDLAGHLTDEQAAKENAERRCTSVGGRDILPVRDEATGKQVLSLDNEAVMWEADETCIWTYGEELSVDVWDVPRAEKLFTLSGTMGSVDEVVWSPDASHIFTSECTFPTPGVCRDRVIQVWDGKTGARLFHIVAERGWWNDNG
ncbi:MAG: TIR domain-containing protein, partial [Anaerolineales bacterium]